MSSSSSSSYSTQNCTKSKDCNCFNCKRTSYLTFERAIPLASSSSSSCWDLSRIPLTDACNLTKPLTLKVKKLHPDAKLPERADAGAAGYDLFSLYQNKIYPGRWFVLNTGISLTIPAGYYGRIAPKSGYAVNNGINVLGGVIDSSYTGEIKVILHNADDDYFNINKGQKIAQLIIEKIGLPTIEEVDELDETERGDKGFGSTDNPKEKGFWDIKDLFADVRKGKLKIIDSGVIGSIESTDKPVTTVIPIKYQTSYEEAKKGYDQYMENKKRKIQEDEDELEIYEDDEPVRFHCSKDPVEPSEDTIDAIDSSTSQPTQDQ